ncbi:hypothetical protein B0H14DRAFT_1648348 [Mycena olivaceomarginata]|nr:hypothetical protein B0H14DRAFT_1648348 [Mycena olivaceomarginata]
MAPICAPSPSVLSLAGVCSPSVHTHTTQSSSRASAAMSPARRTATSHASLKKSLTSTPPPSSPALSSAGPSFPPAAPFSSAPLLPHARPRLPGYTPPSSGSCTSLRTSATSPSTARTPPASGCHRTVRFPPGAPDTTSPGGSSGDARIPQLLARQQGREGVGVYAGEGWCANEQLLPPRAPPRAEPDPEQRRQRAELCARAACGGGHAGRLEVQWHKWHTNHIDPARPTRLRSVWLHIIMEAAPPSSLNSHATPAAHHAHRYHSTLAPVPVGASINSPMPSYLLTYLARLRASTWSGFGSCCISPRGGGSCRLRRRRPCLALLWPRPAR